MAMTPGGAVRLGQADAQKAMLLEAQRSINALVRLDLPRDVEVLVLQLREKVDEHARLHVARYGR